MADEQRVSELFDPALRRLGVRRAVREVQLQEAFAEVVGPAVAPLCRALSLERGALLVATAHTALAHQLQMEAPRIIHALNQRVGDGTVKRLRFTALSGGGGSAAGR
jgi:predicted nucleic acid-binding Zn ribbon protein